MLKTNQGSLRFTQKEIDEFREIGIDLIGVKSSEGFAAAMGTWLQILGDERPALFDKITHAMRADKGNLPK